MEQRERENEDPFRQLAEWLLKYKRSIFLEAGIPKESLRKILHELNYSANMLDD